MKKLFFLLLAAGLFFAADPSVARDSTWLANESVMTSRITRADVNVPVGTIIPWSSAREIKDSDKWLVCDGRAVPRNTELYLDYGMTVTPNLVNDFLRGTNVASEVGRHYEDSLRSHNHNQPGHVHVVDSELTSRAVTGTAKGQEYWDARMGLTGGGDETGIVNMSMSAIRDPDFLKHIGLTSGPGASETYFNFPKFYSGDMTGFINQHNANFSKYYINGMTPHITRIWLDKGDLKTVAGSTQQNGSHSHSVSGSSSGGGSVHGSTSSGGSHSHNISPLDIVGELNVDAYWDAWIYAGIKDNAKDSDVNADVINGHSSGEAHIAGDDPTYFTSAYGAAQVSATSQDINTETAPRHMKVLYLIRCNR